MEWNFNTEIGEVGVGDGHVDHADFSASESEREAVVTRVIPACDTEFASERHEVGDAVVGEEFDCGDVVGVGERCADGGRAVIGTIVVYWAVVLGNAGFSEAGLEVSSNVSWTKSVFVKCKHVVEGFDGGAWLAVAESDVDLTVDVVVVVVS